MTTKREMRKLFASAIDAAIDSQHGEFAWQALADDLAGQHDNPALKDAMWSENVRALFHENLKRRGQIPIHPQLDLWTADDLAQGIIALGDGLAVSYGNATLLHWRTKIQNQTTVIDSTTAQRAKTQEFVAQIEAELSVRLDMTTSDVLRARGFAKPDETTSKRKRPPADEHAPPG